jgi:hypothetical protein
MGKPNYAQMDVNELFAAMEVAAINEHEGFVRGGPQRIKLQHKWADIYNEICEEIQSRGHEALQHYVPLLTAEHPRIRLAAALGLLKTAPDLAIPVLEELRVGKYGGLIATSARMT